MGLDRELSKLKSLQLTDEEKEETTQIGSVGRVVGRQQRGKSLWYEIEKVGRKKTDTQWYPESEILSQMKPYVMKLCKNYDEREKAMQSGLDVRPITSDECIAHLSDVRPLHSYSPLPCHPLLPPNCCLPSAASQLLSPLLHPL